MWRSRAKSWSHGANMCRLSVVYVCLLTCLGVQQVPNSNVTYTIHVADTDPKASRDCKEADVFVCADRQCIPKDQKCDGVTDCSNGRDESVEICGCLPNEFQCNSTHCIDNIKRCDLNIDCLNEEDEQDCETYICPVTHFKCTNHKCVPRDMHCDFEDNCGDNSDEHFCVRQTCLFGYFTCDNGECTDIRRMCDGVPNCKDNSDENPQHCSQQFKCPTGLYVSNMTSCDVWIDCELTHLDQLNCDCPEPHFKCGNGECVSEAAVCDQLCDCVHCEDEMTCDMDFCDDSSRYLCRGKSQAGLTTGHRCLRHRDVCDGVNHCKNTANGVDEFYCGWCLDVW